MDDYKHIEMISKNLNDNMLHEIQKNVKKIEEDGDSEAVWKWVSTLNIEQRRAVFSIEDEDKFSFLLIIKQLLVQLLKRNPPNETGCYLHFAGTSSRPMFPRDEKDEALTSVASALPETMGAFVFRKLNDLVNPSISTIVMPYFEYCDLLVSKLRFGPISFDLQDNNNLANKEGPKEFCVLDILLFNDLSYLKQIITIASCVFCSMNTLFKPDKGPPITKDFRFFSLGGFIADKIYNLAKQRYFQFNNTSRDVVFSFPLLPDTDQFVDFWDSQSSENKRKITGTLVDILKKILQGGNTINSRNTVIIKRQIEKLSSDLFFVDNIPEDYVSSSQAFISYLIYFKIEESDLPIREIHLEVLKRIREAFIEDSALRLIKNEDADEEKKKREAEKSKRKKQKKKEKVKAEKTMKEMEEESNNRLKIVTEILDEVINKVVIDERLSLKKDDLEEKYNNNIENKVENTPIIVSTVEDNNLESSINADEEIRSSNSSTNRKKKKKKDKASNGKDSIGSDNSSIINIDEVPVKVESDQCIDDKVILFIMKEDLKEIQKEEIIKEEKKDKVKEEILSPPVISPKTEERRKSSYSNVMNELTNKIVAVEEKERILDRNPSYKNDLNVNTHVEIMNNIEFKNSVDTPYLDVNLTSVGSSPIHSNYMTDGANKEITLLHVDPSTLSMKGIPEAEILGSIPLSTCLQLHENIKDMSYALQYIAKCRKPQQLAIIGKIRDAVSTLWPGSRVEIFGSFATGLSAPNSDVDLVVCGVFEHYASVLSGNMTTTCIAALASYLKAQEWVQSLNAIDTATVPVIKLMAFFEGGGAVNRFDITFDAPSHRGLATCALVSRLLRDFKALLPLTLVLKQLLVEKGLNDSYTGGLSSYGLLLMIASVLQQYKVGNDENLGKLFILFVSTFGSFNPRKEAISLRNIAVRFPISEADPAFQSDPLVLEDPLYIGNNVGRSCFGISQVLEKFAESLNLIIESKELMKSEVVIVHGTVTLLGIIFGTNHHRNVTRFAAMTFVPPVAPPRDRQPREVEQNATPPRDKGNKSKNGFKILNNKKKNYYDEERLVSSGGGKEMHNTNNSNSNFTLSPDSKENLDRSGSYSSREGSASRGSSGDVGWTQDTWQNRNNRYNNYLSTNYTPPAEVFDPSQAYSSSTNYKYPTRTPPPRYYRGQQYMIPPSPPIYSEPGPLDISMEGEKHVQDWALNAFHLLSKIGQSEKCSVCQAISSHEVSCPILMLLSSYPSSKR